MGMAMSGINTNLNPNGVAVPKPAPGMGIMAMMSAAVPPQMPSLGAAIPGSVSPIVAAHSVNTNPAGGCASTVSSSNAPMTSNLVLGNNSAADRRKSSSPSVSLINVTNPRSHIIEYCTTRRLNSCSNTVLLDGILTFSLILSRSHSILQDIRLQVVESCNVSKH